MLKTYFTKVGITDTKRKEYFFASYNTLEERETNIRLLKDNNCTIIAKYDGQSLDESFLINLIGRRLVSTSNNGKSQIKTYEYNCPSFHKASPSNGNLIIHEHATSAFNCILACCQHTKIGLFYNTNIDIKKETV